MSAAPKWVVLTLLVLASVLALASIVLFIEGIYRDGATSVQCGLAGLISLVGSCALRIIAEFCMDPE